MLNLAAASPNVIGRRFDVEGPKERGVALGIDELGQFPVNPVRPGV
jgi:hypothetical protein